MAKDTYSEHDRQLAQKAWLAALIEKAQKERWFGKITIKMERGDVCQVVKEESLLPPTSRRNGRG